MNSDEPEFFDYLLDMGLLATYSETCGCYACRAAREWFPKWVATPLDEAKETATKTNAEI